MLSYKKFIFYIFFSLSVKVYASDMIIESILEHEWYDPSQEKTICSELHLSKGLVFKFQKNSLELTISSGDQGLIQFHSSTVDIYGTQDNVNPALLHKFFVPIYPLALVLREDGTVYIYNQYTLRESTHIRGTIATGIPKKEFKNGHYKLKHTDTYPSYYLKNEDLLIEIVSASEIRFPRKELTFKFRKDQNALSM